MVDKRSERQPTDADYFLTDDDCMVVNYEGKPVATGTDRESTMQSLREITGGSHPLVWTLDSHGNSVVIGEGGQVVDSGIEQACACKNPEMGFDCMCAWVKAHPGTTLYSCEFCGLYTASEPRCNKCQR